MRRGAFAFVLALGALFWAVVPASAQKTITIRMEAVDPQVLRTTTGSRVDFVNLTNRPMHVQFVGDRREHQVVQIPGTSTIWAVFHSEGRHPYEVHVLDGGRERTLRGVVEVGPGAPPPPLVECGGITVMGACIEP
jgi:hypothetical protein